MLMEENFQNNNQAGPPPPPKPEIKMRTMESDVKSIEETGGGTPEPEMIGPIFKPETNTPEETSFIDISEKKGSGSQWWVWLVVLVMVVVLGLAAYYYVWPLFYPQQPLIEPTVQQPTSGEPAQPITQGHKSAFGFPAGEIMKIDVGDYSVLSFVTAMQNEANKITDDNAVKEIMITVNGEPVVFSSFLSVLLPELANSSLDETLSTNFEDDFTAYLFKADGSVWPGYIVKKRSEMDASAITLLSQLSEIENSSIANLYLEPLSGEPEPFRTGPAGARYTSRYASFKQKPASFNYGLFGDYLIITTTYKGLVRTLELMGL